MSYDLAESSQSIWYSIGRSYRRRLTQQFMLSDLEFLAALPRLNVVLIYSQLPHGNAQLLFPIDLLWKQVHVLNIQSRSQGLLSPYNVGFMELPLIFIGSKCDQAGFSIGSIGSTCQPHSLRLHVIPRLAKAQLGLHAEAHYSQTYVRHS